MAEMFWVQCPDCDGKFYCHTEDLWDSGYDLLCPYCSATFGREVGVTTLANAPHGRVH